jgi:hypothetical protein
MWWCECRDGGSWPVIVDIVGIGKCVSGLVSFVWLGSVWGPAGIE